MIWANSSPFLSVFPGCWKEMWTVPPSQGADAQQPGL